MAVAIPDVGSLWHYPPWTNGKWSGPWRVVGVGLAAEDNEDVPAADLRVVRLERVDGPPESCYVGKPKEVPLIDWPGRWEPWPEVPDFPPT